MKRQFLRVAVYVLFFVVLVGGAGFLGCARSQQNFYGSVYEGPVPASLHDVPPPVYDPNKPTVAVVMGNATTEVFDFMIPYDLFSRTEAYNVFAVAPDKNLKSLTGGLEVIPHYSFNEIDSVLGKSPDIIVVPYMPMVEEQGYKPVREWLQKHGDTTLLSICGGADNLADTGLLKGKSSTMHWQAFGLTTRKYPDTTWRNDLRYVDNGNLISSAGQTAGIDAVLHVISKKLGEPAAAKVAQDIHYPSYQFVSDPKVAPYSIDLRFSTYILNNAFQWNAQHAGVLLYNGMEEMALSSIFDTYADTGTTQVLTVSRSEQPIVTKHRLNLFARAQISTAPKLDKMIVPGTDARSRAADEIKQWSEQGSAKQMLFPHSDTPDRFVFEAPLEDLAKQEDVLTAEHAVKRLEYRANHVTLEGRAMPYETYAELLLTALLAVFAANAFNRRFLKKKAIAKSSFEA